MYSVVLATMLAVGGDAPNFGHHHRGCHGCHGCFGSSCHGCHGCYGSSCHGCWGGGCHGCWGGCHGCYGSSCHGCWGGCSGFSCSGCWGGCSGSVSYGCLGGVWGCYGCYGGVTAAPVVAAPVLAAAPVVAAPVTTVAPASAPDFNNSLTPQEVEQFRRYMREKSGSAPASPQTPTAARSAAPAGSPARLTVKLPADARLWVDHVECPLPSAVRSFNTPALLPGQSYAYTLKVEVNRDGQTLTDSQRVRVTAGGQVNVDFTNVERVATARR